MLTISKQLLQVLCCPKCRGGLHYLNLNKFQLLECNECHQRYPIREGVPILLREGQKSAYDDLYSQIDFKTSPFGYNYEYVVWRKSQINKQIVKYLKEGTVLDDGGGYGFLKEFLDKRRHTYYNLDPSIVLLKYDNSELRCVGEGEALPFKDEVFDNVVSGDVLEHVQDKVKYLEKTYQVLKPGGIFILNTPREGWVDSYKRSIWFWIPYLSFFWTKVRKKLRPKGIGSSIVIPKGVVDVPSNEEWLRDQLERIGYKIVVQSRTDNHLFGLTGPFWRKFADMFINPERYGHCVFFVCKKPENRTNVVQNFTTEG